MASRFVKGAPEAPRVIGLSLKDRSAILPVGRGADAAYWWDTKSGAFVSSTYYLEDVPAWVRTFNDKKSPTRWSAGRGTLLRGSDQGAQGDAGDRGSARSTTRCMGSPFGNDLLMDLADQALTNERLGQRGVTDLLSVSFSSNDSVGHTHGPDSPQVRDIAIRTDRTIGASPRPRRQAGRTPAHPRRVHDRSRRRTCPRGDAETVAPRWPHLDEGVVRADRMALQERFGEGKWVLSTAGSSPYLNYELDDETQARSGGGASRRR